MGMSWAEHSLEVDAPIEVAFDAIVDYESFPRWQNAVDRTEVIDHTPEGIGQTVRLYVDAKIRKIDYTLRYRYERPARIEWDFVEGNGMRDLDGVYSFEDLGGGRCRATYKLGADPEIPVPGFVLKRTHKQLVQRSVEDLKREAERRAAEAPQPGSVPPPQAAPVTPPPEAVPPGAAPGPPASPPEPEPEPAGAPPPPEPEPATAASAGSWVPMAVRVRREAAPPPRPSAGPAPPPTSPRSAPPPPPSSAERDPLADGAEGAGASPQGGPEELADRAAEAAAQAVRIGRDVADTALRTGMEVGRHLVERIDRKLAGRDPYEDRSRDEEL